VINSLSHNHAYLQKLYKDLANIFGTLPGPGEFSELAPPLVAGARIWNDLPSDVTSSPSLFTFKRRLKMHLFRLSYPDLTF